MDSVQAGGKLMKFTVNRKEMYNAVRKALKTASLVNDIVITEGVLIEANSENNIVSVICTDLRTRIMCRVKAQSISESGSMILKPIVCSMLKFLEGETVEFYTDSLNKNEVNIKSGRAVYTVPFMEASAFPTVPTPYPQDMVCIEGINNLIKRAAFAAEDKQVESNQKILQFVNLKLGCGTAQATATDGSFMAVSNTPISSSGNLDMLIHEKAIKSLSEIISADETLFVGTAENYAVFIKEDMMFHTMMLNERFVDVGAAISKLNPAYKVTADVGQMKALVLDVLALLREGDDRCINLSADINMLKAYCVTALGQSNAHINVLCNTSTPSDGYNYNSNILLECLTHVSGPVELLFDNRGFMIIASEHSRYLVCPRSAAQIRVQEEKKPKKETASKKPKAKKTTAKAA